MKEITIDGVEYILTLKQQEFTYPIWFKSRSSTQIVKFDGLNSGITVVAGGVYSVGDSSDEWVPHTDTEVWEQVEEPNKLNDKDAIWCWDNEDTSTRCVKFWDAKNNCTFYFNGARNDSVFHNYEKIQPDDEPNWVKEARKHLED